MMTITFTIETDLEGFKTLVRDFVLNIEHCDNLDQLDNGFKAVSLAYLGTKAKNEAEEQLILSALDYARSQHLKAIPVIIAKEQPMNDINISVNAQIDYRGLNDDEYQIYATNAIAMGWTVKTYDEWLDS